MTHSPNVDCDDVFELDEAYLLGLEGFDEPAFNPDCLNACGDYIPCQNEPGYAMEEIEKHINANYPKPDCGTGMIWDGTYSSIITQSFFLDNWFDGFPDCLENIDMKACTCLEDVTLSCMYCTLLDAINDTGDPFGIEIPNGYHFISINFGVDHLLYPLPLNQLPTALYGSYTFGIPNCIEGVVNPGPWVHNVLYMYLSIYKK